MGRTISTRDAEATTTACPAARCHAIRSRASVKQTGSMDVPRESRTVRSRRAGSHPRASAPSASAMRSIVSVSAPRSR